MDNLEKVLYEILYRRKKIYIIKTLSNIIFIAMLVFLFLWLLSFWAINNRTYSVVIFITLFACALAVLIIESAHKEALKDTDYLKKQAKAISKTSRRYEAGHIDIVKNNIKNAHDNFYKESFLIEVINICGKNRKIERISHNIEELKYTVDFYSEEIKKKRLSDRYPKFKVIYMLYDKNLDNAADSIPYRYDEFYYRKGSNTPLEILVEASRLKIKYIKEHTKN